MIRAFSLFSTMAAMLVLFPFPTPAADDVNIRPEQVLSVVTADWNDDGGFDRAVLLESDKQPGGTELLIYLSDPNTDTMQLALRKTNPAWSGNMWGTLPRLELDKDNNLVIHSQNDSIGRNHWQQAVTVHYKDKRFIISNYAIAEQDTLKLGTDSTCVYNLMTGTGFKDGKPFKANREILLLADFSDELSDVPCNK